MAAAVISRSGVTSSRIQKEALRGQHQVTVVHRDVGDRRHGEVLLEGLPVRSVVEGDVRAELGAGVEKTLALRVLAHHAREVVRGDSVRAVREQAPRAAVVRGLIQPGVRVGLPVAIRGHVHAPGRPRGDVDGVHRRALGEAPRRHVRPRGAVVAGHVDEPVVAPRPQHARLQGRLLEREHGAVDLDPRAVVRDGTAGVALVLRVVRGEVGADHLPALAAVARAVHPVGGVVEDVGVVGRDADGRVPLESVA